MHKFLPRTALSLLLCAALLAGCGAPQPASPAQPPAGPVIIAANFPLYDFARIIGGEAAAVSLLLPPGTQGHSFEPTPQDIIRLENCDLFLYIGGESDAWVDRVLQSMDTPPPALRLMDSVRILEEEYQTGMQSGHPGHAQEDSHTHAGEYDEHIWTSPQNAIAMVSSIAAAMQGIAPDQADAFGENAVTYTNRLRTLHEEFRYIAANGQLHTLVFGDRFPFLYFTREYGLEYYAAFPGCAEETEPSAATVAFLIDTVRERNIPAVFHIELSSEAMADTIAEATGAKKLRLHSCHNLSQAELDAGETYLSLMEQNRDALREALLCP